MKRPQENYRTAFRLAFCVSPFAFLEFLLAPSLFLSDSGRLSPYAVAAVSAMQEENNWLRDKGVS